ncbi:Aste57867_913 [Aphanomyces stellatus]|uniref:Aste57867_913 protein n=1 Tax=Aphanomyces stellatus TaxID=120398 RepID=A0A485K467_9STRA|nr:hypothetical protein As57867_000912 [Aphanomyces stellatus]VFT78137.1 Aste57867_913 [Aphanomyces stellatus]
MKLPLPPNFFQCPPLSADEAARLQQQAYTNAMDVVNMAMIQHTDHISWTLMKDDSSGLKIYRGIDQSEGLDHVKLCVGVAEVAGTIDELVDLFRNDTTERAKEFVQRFGKGLLDSANLYTLAAPTFAQPNDRVAINWMAFKPPIKNVVMPRDCCYLEGHYDFRDVRGRRGWVRSLKSISMLCCPDMQHTLGLVRMVHLGSGHVFVEADRPGYVRIAYVVHSAFNVNGPLQGLASDWALEMAIKKRCSSLLDIDTFLRENRLAKGTFLLGDQLVPKELRHDCSLCLKKFGLFVPKTNCFKCGDVFCSACSRVWHIKVCGVPTRIEACTLCALRRPAESKAVLDRASRDDSTTSSMLSLRAIRVVRGSQSSTSSTPSSRSSLSMDRQRSNEKWIQALIQSNSLLSMHGVNPENDTPKTLDVAPEDAHEPIQLG